MKNKDNYILVTWGWQDNGDHDDSFETFFEFVTDKQLDDINKLMKEWGIKQWVKDPHTVTSATYRQGDGALVEYRNVIVKPIKIVESWSYKPEIING